MVGISWFALSRHSNSYLEIPCWFLYWKVTDVPVRSVNVGSGGAAQRSRIPIEMNFYLHLTRNTFTYPHLIDLGESGLLLPLRLSLRKYINTSTDTLAVFRINSEATLLPPKNGRKNRLKIA